MSTNDFKILNRGGYEAPLTEVVEVLYESILCGSEKQVGAALDDLVEENYHF